MVSVFHRALSSITRLAQRQNTHGPEAPNGQCIYAIGDIHGERQCLDSLLAAISADFHQRFNEQDVRKIIIFLGDYIDRGPDSRGVLDILCRLAAESRAGDGPACRFLCGNHETALLDFLADPVAEAEWLSYGGAETLASYGIRASTGITAPARCRALRDSLAERLPEAHRTFLDQLEPMVVLGDYAFVHAGIRPGIALERQRPEDLQRIREPFLSSHRRHPKVIVHGHTPVAEAQILPNRIAVDTGAYATGSLSAANLYGLEAKILTVARRPGY